MIQVQIISLLLAFLGGLFATLLMTLWEIIPWKKWGLYGVLEWHENQILSVKFFRLPESKLHLKEIVLFHFINGGLGGIGYLFALCVIPIGMTNLLLSGIFYGFFLWIVTLIPIHKPITGISPWNHPNGIMPSVVSCIGHIIYGIAIGFFFLIFLK